MTITATATDPTARFTEGQQVALFRRTTVSPNTGVQEDWYVAPAGQAHDGPSRPAWGDPTGYSEQWTGCGLGTIRTVREQTRDLVIYEVQETSA